jgi:hypothetical protein
VEAGWERGDTLYAGILGAGLANVVSFNVDHRLVRRIASSRRVGPAAGTSFFYRRVRVQGGRPDGTNIWFPYGDASEPSSIQIGHSLYDERLVLLEDYRDRMMGRWFDWSSGYARWELRPPEKVYWRLWNQIESWYDLSVSERVRRTGRHSICWRVRRELQRQVMAL